MNAAWDLKVLCGVYRKNRQVKKYKIPKNSEKTLAFSKNRCYTIDRAFGETLSLCLFMPKSSRSREQMVKGGLTNEG